MKQLKLACCRECVCERELFKLAQTHSVFSTCPALELGRGGTSIQPRDHRAFIARNYTCIHLEALSSPGIVRSYCPQSRATRIDMYAGHGGQRRRCIYTHAEETERLLPCAFSARLSLNRAQPNPAVVGRRKQERRIQQSTQRERACEFKTVYIYMNCSKISRLGRALHSAIGQTRSPRVSFSLSASASLYNNASNCRSAHLPIIWEDGATDGLTAVGIICRRAKISTGLFSRRHCPPPPLIISNQQPVEFQRFH